jgi:hypothetical protein
MFLEGWTNQEIVFPSHVFQGRANQEILFPNHVYRANKETLSPSHIFEEQVTMLFIAVVVSKI